MFNWFRSRKKPVVVAHDELEDDRQEMPDDDFFEQIKEAEPEKDPREMAVDAVTLTGLRAVSHTLEQGRPPTETQERILELVDELAPAPGPEDVLHVIGIVEQKVAAGEALTEAEMAIWQRIEADRLAATARRQACDEIDSPARAELQAWRYIKQVWQKDWRQLYPSDDGYRWPTVTHGYLQLRNLIRANVSRILDPDSALYHPGTEKAEFDKTLEALSRAMKTERRHRLHHAKSSKQLVKGKA